MSADLTSHDAILKQHYTDDLVEDLVYQDNPLLALMPKMESFGGKNLPIPLIYGNPQGRSKTFSNAQTRGAASSSSITDFLLTRVKDYSIATIDNETLEATKGNSNAFIEAATTEIDGAINSLTRSLAIGMYRDSAASLGQVSATPSSQVIIMKDVEDITNIEVGMAVEFHDAKSGGNETNIDTANSQTFVASVDRSAGSFTLDVAQDGGNDIGADDYIFVEGDRGLGISGLEGWIPSVAPGATAFFGVDRTADLTRLSGVRSAGAAKPIEEALIDGCSEVAREGGKVDHCFLSYAKFAELEKALGSKVQYVDLEKSANVGFRGIMIQGPKGAVKVIPDQNCQGDRAYLLQLNTWKFYSLGKAVRVIDTDGLQMLRQASSDGVEVRYGFYGNVGCKAPGYNCVVTLS
jgi:hypothetical protein